MKFSHRLRSLAQKKQSLRTSFSIAALLALFSAPARTTSAATLYWDADGATTTATGGTGTWNLSTPSLWRNGSSTGTLQNWTDTTGTSDIADFGGFPGTVTLGVTLGAVGLVFDTAGYTLATSTFTLSLGASGITANSPATGTTTISGTGSLSLVASQSWAVSLGNALAANAPVALGANTLTLATTGANTISGVVSGTGNITKTGTGTATLSGANTYTGVTTISGGILSASTLAAGGTASSIGKSSNAATNLVLDGGTLQFVGTAAATTDRLFTLTQNGGGIDSSSGASTYAATFSNTGALTYTGSGARTFTLSGTNTGANTFAPVLGDGTGGSTSLAKTGAGSWVLTNANTYTGTTTLGVANSVASGGTLTVNGAAGSIVSSSGITVNGSGSQLLLDNSFITTAAAAVNRISDSATVTLNYGGNFQLNGSNTTGVSLSETVGSVTLGTGAGIVSISEGASSTAVITLTAGSFSRGSNFATALVRGTNLGQSTSTSARFTLTDSSGLTLIGTTSSNSGTDNGTIKNLKIVPYLLGASSASSTSAAYLGGSFVTYDAATNALRRLAPNEVSLITAATAGDNVETSTSINNVTGPLTVNSVLLNSGGSPTAPGTTASTVVGSGALTITSGAMANTATGSSATVGVSGFSSLIFGTTGANEAIITHH